MLYLTANPGDKLILGRAGEHLARTVRFDIARWRALYGDGTAALILRRPGEADPYPCVVSQEGDIVTWPITRVETAQAGATGRYELQYLVGEQVVKSATGIAVVYDALSEPAEEPPEAQQGWVDQVLAAGAAAAEAARTAADYAEDTKKITQETVVPAAEDAAASAESAAESADRAEAAAVHTPKLSRENTWLIWDKGKNEYVDTKVSAVGPRGATPVKGEDYWSDEDKAEIVQNVLDALPTWEGGSY